MDQAQKEAARMEAARGLADSMREIAREEIASLCGLILERLGQLDPGVVDRSELASIFGEGLRDFSATPDEPGPKTLDVGGGIAPEGEASV